MQDAAGGLDHLCPHVADFILPYSSGRRTIELTSSCLAHSSPEAHVFAKKLGRG